MRLIKIRPQGRRGGNLEAIYWHIWQQIMVMILWGNHLPNQVPVDLSSKSTDNTHEDYGPADVSGFVFTGWDMKFYYFDYDFFFEKKNLFVQL